MKSNRNFKAPLLAALTCAIGSMVVSIVAAASGPLPELEWLSMPSDVAIGKGNHVYVVDSGNHRVAVFDANGAKLTTLGMFGSDEGQLMSPLGIGISNKGEVYVADKGNGRIVMFDANGRPKKAFALEADGEEVVPIDVAVDPKGKELYVTDNKSHKVVVFDIRGEFQRAWGGEGEDDGQFRYPATIDIDAAGNVYVVDVLNARVQKFDAAGTHLLTIGERGGKAGTFFRPKGVAVDAAGNVYVSDSFLGAVQVFDPAGAFHYVIADDGETTVFETPVGMAAGGGKLYVAQMLPGKVAIVEPTPPPPPAEEAAE